jgi:iron complex outermembrane recepter protein
VTLRGSVGQAFNTPNLFQMYTRSQTSLNNWTDGNPDLKPETVTSWEVGGDWRIPGTGTKLRATYYENYLEDLIYTRAVAEAGGTHSYRVNAGEAVVKGVEAGIEQKLPVDGLSAFTNFTHNDSEMIKNDASPTTVGKQLTFTPEWMVNGGLNYKKGQWSGFVNGRWVSKVYSDDQNRDIASGLPTFYDAYFTVDSKVSYEFEKGVTLSLIGTNLLDRKYYEYYQQPGRVIMGQLSYRY